MLRICESLIQIIKISKGQRSQQKLKITDNLQVMHLQKAALLTL